jgi:prepilin-type N-terminal cleavage/methylation domain-containing protein
MTSPRRSAFTLVEMLVVIGIIVVIVGITVPMASRATRQAARVKAARDLEAIRTALEEFKNINGDYPQIGYPFSANAAANSVNGQEALYCALVGRDQKPPVANPKQGNPILNGKSGQTAKALINVESFHVKINTNTAGDRGQIFDDNNKPYLYFPARVPAPNIHSANNSGMYVRDYSNAAAPGPLYDHLNCGVGGSFPLSLADMRYILGDGNKVGNKPQNGAIDSNLDEHPSTTAPYILWAAGPDGIFGLDPVNFKTDDVTNFDIPGQYKR